MNDIMIFGLGTFVSLIVAGAVSLLVWGAAHEPSGEQDLPRGSEREASPAPRGAGAAR